MEALTHHALSKGLRQRGRRRAHIVAYSHGVFAFFAQDCGEGGASIAHEVFIDIFAHHATDVIGLNHCIKMLTSSHTSQYYSLPTGN